MIKINNLTFGYFDSEIFRNLSFSVEEGEIFTLLGPNGSGKTTLLKCIERLLEPKGGGVYISEKNVRSFTQKELAKTVATVPQMHKISFPFTVLDVVLMGRNPHLDFFSSPGKKDVLIAEDVLKEVGIYNLRYMPYTDISGGELRLALIARALAQSTNILILDEPTAFLDFKNEYLIMNKIKQLKNKRSLTVIMSMHDPNIAIKFSDRILLMKRREVVAMGLPKEVLTKDNLRKAYDIEAEIVNLNGETFIFQK